MKAYYSWFRGGRLSEEKGIKNLIDTILELKEKNIKFLIIGEGEIRDKVKVTNYE